MKPVMIGVLMSGLILPNAFAACPPGNASVPPGANTRDPSAPFFVDTA